MSATPDFTGDWILSVTDSALSPMVAPKVESGFVRIDHREPTVSVHLCVVMEGKPSEARFERPAEWEGDALLFVDTFPTPDGELTSGFRYALEAGGRRRRATEWLRGAREQDNVWVFDLQEATEAAELTER